MSGCTVTGNSVGNVIAAASAPNARRCSRRQLNSRLALMPCSCASAATDAPGRRLRSTRSNFNASLCLRRVSLMTRLSMCASDRLRAHIQACAPSRDRAHPAGGKQEGLETALTSGEYSRSDVTTNSVESSFAILKRGL